MLILMRHGRTAGNAAGQLQGHLDLPLDDVGVDQAAQVVAALGSVDRVISSSLQRATATAAMFGLPVDVDDRWIELDYGELDGQPLESVSAETWAQWRTDRNFRPPGGESMHDLDKRVRAAAADALVDAEHRNVVVVSHVSPIKAAMAWALDCDVLIGFRCFLAHAGVSRIAHGSGGPVLRSFNEILYR